MSVSGKVHAIFLAILTIGGCCFGASIVLLYAMFMVTCDFFWFYFLPVAIIVINLLSIPAYRNRLAGRWKYLYNFCITILVTAICYYGAIQWTSDSIHGDRGSRGLQLGIVIIVILSIAGMLKSKKASQEKMFPK